MFLTAVVRTDDGESLGVLVLKPKTFSSGRVGWFGQGKIEIGGERHQAQCQVVRIGEPGGRGDDKEPYAVVHHYVSEAVEEPS